MEISKRLNFVIPFEQGGVVRYVHAVPITRAVFERYYLVLAKTFARIYGEGLGLLAGPRVAALILKTVAEEMNVSDEVENGLIPEIRQRCNVVDGSGTLVPYVDAIRDKLISEDDAAEVDNAIAFFTVASAMHKREELAVILKGAATYWGAQVSSSSPTEFAASLKTSTAPATTGATPKADVSTSSLPG